MPLLIAPTPEAEMPEVLRGLQYVDFTDNTCQADYDSDIDDILNILRRDQEYYEQHKILLAWALKWQAEDDKPSFLLRGHNLDNAKTWWRLNEKREQHPPLALHKKLIISSEAAKGQLGTEVFISYSRKDGDFARQLNIALQEAGKTTWFDQESISTGVDFEKEIFKGIASSDNFVFVISPDAVTSDYCEREVNYASEKNKRFISVLHRETDPTTMPKALQMIHWIYFTNTTFDKSFLELVQAIELDREHAHQHTVLQQRGSDWAENNRSKDFLLNITACKNAEIWRDTALAENKPPAPTQLQQDFIQQSRKAIKATKRKEQQRQILSGHTDTIDHSIFSHDGQQVVTASEDSTIRIWDANTGKQLNILKGHEDFVTYIELSPNGQRLLSVSEDNTARLWDINTGQQLILLEGHKERLRHATLSADGLTVVTASDDKTARLWDANTGQQRLVLHGHTKEVVQVAFSPDNQYVATASWDKTAKIWDAYTGKLLFTLDHKYKVEKVTFSPDGPQLLTVSIDWKWQGMASLWNAKNGQQLNMFPHTKAVLHADFSPDGTQVITGSKDNTARLWNTIKRQQIPTTLTGHRDDVYDATFSPDGKKVMTVSLDHTARLWDTESGQQLAVMSGHTDEIYQAAFSPDGKKVVTSSVDETARVWRIFATTQELIDYANHVVPRCLTQAQRDEFFLSPNKSHALIEAGEKLAQAGKIEAAVVKFQQALQQAPCLKLEPINQAQQIATHSLMKQGHELIKQEQIEAALAKFNRVREINPHLNFEPLNLVRKITALTLMDKSTQLAQQGKVKAAVAGFQTALRIDSNLNFDPEKKAQQIVANVRINKGAKLVQQGDLIMVKDAFQMALTGEMNSSVDSKFQRIRANYLLRTGTELAQRGDIEKAIAIYKEIPQSVSISAYFWNRLCWYGSLHQKAFEVMDLCAKAVELEPENEWFRRVRGINSALISDSQAAIEDFQFLVAKTPYNDLNQQVRKWIRTLRRGKNPFTPTVQKLLLLHGTTSKQPPKWCAGELNNAEQVICHNEKLWNLEDQSHNSYYRWHDSLPNLEDRDRATKELYNWLEHRNAQCSRSIKFCLQVYEERVKLLNLRHRNETWEEKNYSEF